MALEKKHKMAIGAVIALVVVAIGMRAYKKKHPRSGFCGKSWDPAATAEVDALAVMGTV